MATGVREERETECVAHVFALELERVGEVVDRRDLPLVEHPEPRHSPRDGPENRAVGLELGRVRSLDLLAPRDVRELHRHTDDEVARVIAIRIRQRHIRGRHAKAREVERDVDGRLEDAHVTHEGANQGASVERVEAGEERAGLAERGTPSALSWTAVCLVDPCFMM